MSLSRPLPTQPQNAFEAARLTLIRKLLAIKVPAGLPVFPRAADFVAVKGHLIEAAGIFDEWLAACGSEVRASASCAIDRDMFAGSFTGAIDGNETHMVDRCVEAIDPDASTDLEEIVGHLGAALMQAQPSDDPVIMDHVQSAHSLALGTWRRTRNATGA